MILSIICALLCFLLSIFLFTKRFSDNMLAKPLSVFLLFEGTFVMFSHIFCELNPTSNAPQLIQCIGIIICLLYFALSIAFFGRNPFRRIKKEKEDKEI